MTGIGGVYAAAITPRRRNGAEIDLAAIFELIDFLCTRKVAGIVLMGSTGEFIHYSIEERIRLAGLAIKRSRVPVIVNASHSTLDGAIEIGQAAAKSGAAAVLLMPPYFFHYSQADLLPFFREFASRTDPRCPRLLYHIPLFTSPIAVETADALLGDGEWRGIKDSSGDLTNIERLLQLRVRTECTVMIGSDAHLRQAVAGGADGVISGVASALPELLVALYRSVAANQPEVTARLETRVSQFLAWFERFPVPVAIREAAQLRGIQAGPHAAGAARETELAGFRQWFRDWLPQVEREAAHA